LASAKDTNSAPSVNTDESTKSLVNKHLGVIKKRTWEAITFDPPGKKAYIHGSLFLGGTPEVTSELKSLIQEHKGRLDKLARFL
jgi:hypothetical protein